jgi:hypothetical protein
LVAQFAGACRAPDEFVASLIVRAVATTESATTDSIA